MTKIILASAALAAFLCGAPLAMAAGDSTPGDTSGPASGSVAKPSVAVQKQTGSPSATAGGAGVAGKPGGEAGATPKDPGGSGQTTKH